MQFSVEVRAEGSWSVVDVHGEIDLSTAPKLRARIVELVAEGRNRIVANLEGVEFMDSTGLGVLMGALRRVREQDGELVLVCTNRPVLRILDLTSLDKVFHIYDSVDAAIASGS